MQRIARFGRLKPDVIDKYRTLHQKMSKELLEAHKSAGFHNFSIYLRGVELFCYVECDHWESSLKKFSAQQIAQEWSAKIQTLLDEPLNWEILEEIWHLD